jgi:CHAD domain-containing protein
LIEGRVATLLRRRRQVQRWGTPTAIHDLRVATRRLQEALEVFASALPERERERLRRRARSIRRRFAEVRDADVLLDLVRARRRVAGGRSASGLAGLERELLVRTGFLRGQLSRSRRAQGLSDRGLRVRGLRKRAESLLQSPAWGAGARVAAAAAGVVARRARAVREALRPARGGRAGPLHRLRVAVKRYRYGLETLQAWGMTTLDLGLAAARDLQERLGAIHDLDVLILLVRRAPAAPALQELRAERRRRSREARQAIAAFRPLPWSSLRPGAVVPAVAGRSQTA